MVSKYPLFLISLFVPNLTNILLYVGNTQITSIGDLCCDAGRVFVFLLTRVTVDLIYGITLNLGRHSVTFLE